MKGVRKSSLNRIPPPPRLLCTGNYSPAKAPQGKVSLRPFLVRSTSQLLSPSLSAVSLKPLETLTDGALAAWQSHTPRPHVVPAAASEPAPFQGTGHSSQVHWGWGCHSRGGWLQGWNWDCIWEPHHWLCQVSWALNWLSVSRGLGRDIWGS